MVWLLSLGTTTINRKDTDIMAMTRKEVQESFLKDIQKLKEIIEEELGKGASEEEKEQALHRVLDLYSYQMFHAKMK